MDYEKKYKEALERAKAFELPEYKNIAESIFPELKNEDEKIRKALVRFHKSTIDIDGIKGADILAWLEKQGINYSLVEEIKKRKDSFMREKEKAVSSNDKLSLGARIAMLEELLVFVKEKQAEQKPTSDTKYEVKAGGSLSVNGKPFDYEHATITQNDFASVGETATIELSSPIDCGDRIYHVSHKPIEKNGEQKPILDFKAKDWYVSKVDGKIHNMTYNPANKVEPKFKVGDWVVTDKNDRVQIKAVNNDYYTIDNGMYFNIPYVDKYWHLWTIQDAKDGDVLAGNKGDVILMFRRIGNTEWNDVIDYHCYYDCYLKDFIVQKDLQHWGDTNNNQLKPATKEQRDILFQKMKEAGYEFDFDNKELKKIEDEECNGEDYGIDGLWHAQRILEKTLGSVDGYQSDDGILEHKAAITAVKKLCEKKTAWSKEDEKMYTVALSCIETLEDISNGKNMHADVKDWLKSLKDRIGG